jgi:hypothetical protein
LRSDVDTVVARETSLQGEVLQGTTVLERFARTEGPPLRMDFAAAKQRIRIIGKTVFISPTKADGVPSGIAWIRYGPADLRKTTKAARQQLTAARDYMADLSDDFALLGHVANLVTMGERVEGTVSVHGWAGLVSVADLLADPVTREGVQPMARIFGANTMMSLRIWLDSKNRPALLTLSSGGKSFDTHYTGWGESVNIPTPPAGTFVPFR